VNYSEARACAWQERLAQESGLRQNPEEPTAWVVGGSLILADIYFNGSGVKRDVPLAMRFACESDEGMARLAIPDIEKFSGSSHGEFEFCDYAATTFTMNFCNGYKSEIEDDRRNRYYDSLKVSMIKVQRDAFENLLAAQNAYIEAHASEVDQGGTIRGIRTIGSQHILKDLFQRQLIRYEQKKWPAVSDDQVSTANAKLSREYEKKLKRLNMHTKEEIDGGAVTGDDLSRVEKIWERYRDAWVAFARLRYPTAVDAIRADITLSRYRLVKTIL